MSIEIREERTPDGRLEKKSYLLNGQFHRDDGPARESFYEDGKPAYRAWYIHGKRHRIDGPAREQFSPDGTLEVYGWHLNGKKHREDGPAYESFIANNGPVAQYWVNYPSLKEGACNRVRTGYRFLSGSS